MKSSVSHDWCCYSFFKEGKEMRAKFLSDVCLYFWNPVCTSEILSVHSLELNIYFSLSTPEVSGIFQEIFLKALKKNPNQSQIYLRINKKISKANKRNWAIRRLLPYGSVLALLQSPVWKDSTRKVENSWTDGEHHPQSLSSFVQVCPVCPPKCWVAGAICLWLSAICSLLMTLSYLPPSQPSRSFEPPKIRISEKPMICILYWYWIQRFFWDPDFCFVPIVLRRGNTQP